MIVLAIETSCDETAISLLEAGGGFTRPKFKIFSHLVASQAALHAPWGGVVPMLAKREHSQNLIPLLKQVLIENELLVVGSEDKVLAKKIESKVRKILAREPELLERFLKFIPKIKVPKIDVLAVTAGPGLEPALWVGVNLARALALVWQKPLVAVNHLEGHILSPLIDPAQAARWRFPALALLVSGGHTQLVLIKNWFKYEIVGETRDDAAGEAFDKVARILELPYPGGPEIGKLASQSNPYRLTPNPYPLPRPMQHSPDLDFSFSGLKTAVLYLVKKLGKLDQQTKANIAREFQQAVIDVLLTKTMLAIKKYNPQILVIGGGVIANDELKKQFAEKLTKDFPNTYLLTPRLQFATDNATMIGVAGYFRALKKHFTPNPRANGNLRL